MNSKRFQAQVRMVLTTLALCGAICFSPPNVRAQEEPAPAAPAESTEAATPEELSETAETATVGAEEGKVSEGLAGAMDSFIATINEHVGGVLFFDVSFGWFQTGEVDRAGDPVIDPATGLQAIKKADVPFIVAVLVFGAIFFTFWYGWINIRGFKHSIDVIRGKYDDPEDTGEISHFQALTSALSATVGLGNIAGVAIAIQLGGPGAVFWMMMAAVFGMSAKFSSCTLAQLYRQTNPDGSISGGPMYYLDLGLKAKGPKWAPWGKILGVMFAIMVMGGALGGGNMFQSNQSFEALASTFGVIDADNDWHQLGFGLMMAFMVGLVILGGIKRIGAATSKIVPLMCGIYILASLYIIMKNLGAVPESIKLIFTMAFTTDAYYGGLVGVLIMGVQRAAFSNEAGLGSAAIAHAAAKTNEPVREGFVAMIGPFIDTIIICLMTASVVIITGTWSDPTIPQKAGVALTTKAFGAGISWFPYVLTVCIILFAYSTMISWCYYGERGWIYLLDHFGGAGLKTVLVFRIVFVIFVIIGAGASLSNVIEFSDMMLFSMAFPNIVGSVILAPIVLKKVNEYWGRYKSGEMKKVG